MARDGGFGGYGGAPSGGDDPEANAADPADAIGGFGPPGGVPPLGGPMTPGSGREVDTMLPLVLSIGSTLLCCNPILGVPAIVLAIQARNAANMGAIDVAQKRARWALIVASLAIGVGLLIEAFEGIHYFATFAASVR